MLANSDYQKIDTIRKLCKSIVQEYEKIIPSKLVPASRDILSYARAALTLCDAIELGHRDSSITSAFTELDSLLSSMTTLKTRME